MAVDYSVLFQGPTIGQRITQSQEANRLREESDVRNQLSRMQLEDARRKMEEDEYMNRLLARPEAVTPSGINYEPLIQQAQTEGRGRLVPTLLQASAAQRKTRAEEEKSSLERVRAKLAMLPEAYKTAYLSDDPATAAIGVHDYVHSDDDLRKWLASQGATADKGLAQIQAAAEKGPDAVRELLAKSSQSLSDILKSFEPKVVAPSASVYDPRTGTFTQAPGAPVKSRLMTPEEEAQAIRIARESRPPAAPREPAAPTITQIQDPTNPNQMITINARVYQGGGVGAPGVIGTTGKTPAATAAAAKREEGNAQARDILDTLRAAYDTLDRERAVPSQQRNVLSNAISYFAGTGIGQVAGRVAGTEAQTQRDIIQSARNQMLNAVKNATGMSAQQLNSNVEFRSWLEALTDPTRSIEANRAILDNMERFIASGGTYTAKEKSSDGGRPTPSKPGGAPTGGWSVVR